MKPTTPMALHASCRVASDRAAFGATRVEPVNQHKTKAVEQRGTRQEQWVGVRRESAHRNVRDEDERAEAEPVRQDVGRHVL